MSSNNSNRNSTLAPFRLVLVRPKTASNVGACVRLGANFELRDIAIVAPRCEWKNSASSETARLATGIAKLFLKNVKEYETLEAAIGDCQAAVGFTRRNGQFRMPTLTLPELARLPIPVARQSVALVFGAEDTGLSADELKHCSHVCTIPTPELMPSLNLSHAAAIVAARLHEERALMAQGRRAHAQRSPLPATLEEVEGFFDHWREYLVDIGMIAGGNPERILKQLRKFYHRSAMSAREVRLLRGIMSKAQVALGVRQRGKRVSPTVNKT